MGEGATFDQQAEGFARAFEGACQEAARREEFAGVYVSPLWEQETSGAPDDVRAWKRSVLRRIAGAGAEPWGHLFLVVTREGTGVPVARTSDPAGLLAGPLRAPPRLFRTVHEGAPRALLLLRPRSEENGDSLEAFATAVVDSFTVPRALLGP